MNRIPVYYDASWHKTPTECAPSHTQEPSTCAQIHSDIQRAMLDVAQYIPYADIANTIIYDGNPASKIMIIGEAPGAEEVLAHKPFVGRSGKLLQTMLDFAGLHRDKIYVTNVMPWRPPMNRPPLPQEISILRPILLEHIKQIQPQILLLVGGIAHRTFTDSTVAISKIRGQWFASDICKNVLTTFHPSFLLRSPSHKQQSWNDMMEVHLLAQKLNLDIGNHYLRNTHCRSKL